MLQKNTLQTDQKPDILDVISGMTDQQLLQTTNDAVDQYRRLLDHYQRTNRGMERALQLGLPDPMNDLLNECAVRNLVVNPL